MLGTAGGEDGGGGGEGVEVVLAEGFVEGVFALGEAEEFFADEGDGGEGGEGLEGEV